MSSYVPYKRQPRPRPFSVVDSMSEIEMRTMFLSVSVRSLKEWLRYYLQRDKPEVCRIIREVSGYKV